MSATTAIKLAARKVRDLRQHHEDRLYSLADIVMDLAGLVGSGGTTHAALPDVTADQHHAQSHASTSHSFPGGTTTFLRADGTYATPATGGATVGTAVLDFGTFPGAADTSVTVVGQAAILTGSTVIVALRPIVTAEHTADEHCLEELNVCASDIVAATGFTIKGNATGKQRLYGQYAVGWLWA